MANSYNLTYPETAADFLLSLNRGRLASLLYDLRCLASDPFVRSDYSVADNYGRPVEHILISDFVIAYWVDHATSEIRIVDITDVS
jgi:hypothetical protein